MRIYTRTGDKGTTGLLGGKRVKKTDPRIEAHGEVDELNALIGFIRSEKLQEEIDRLLERIQGTLFDLGLSINAANLAEKLRKKIRSFNPQETDFLENQIDFYDAKNFPLRNFILPGGSRIASLFHLARTVCRRTERAMVKLKAREAIPYLNRLSDLLFILARFENKRSRKKETIWEGLRNRKETVWRGITAA